MNIDTRKIRRESEAGAVVRRVFDLWLGRVPFQLWFYDCQIAVDGLIEQALLLVTELLASGGKLPALKCSHLVHELRELRAAEA